MEDVQRRQFLRLLLVSAFAHGLLVSGLMTAPWWTPRRPLLQPVVTVDLVAPAPQAAPKPAAPKPAPKPKALPAPKPEPKPKPKKELLPAQPRKEPEQVKPKQPEPVEYEDVLAQLRSERGETVPTPAVKPEATASAAARGGPGRVDPELAAWTQAVRIHLSRSWVLAPGLRAQPLVAVVEVRLDAQGNVVDEPRILRRSGNPWFDDSVERAVQRASPLPAPPRAGDWEITFDPEDFF